MITEEEINSAANERGIFTHGKKPTEARVHFRVGFIEGATWAQEKLKPVETTGIEKMMEKFASISQLLARRQVVAKHILLGSENSDILKVELESINNRLREYLGL